MVNIISSKLSFTFYPVFADTSRKGIFNYWDKRSPYYLLISRFTKSRSDLLAIIYLTISLGPYYYI